MSIVHHLREMAVYRTLLLTLLWAVQTVCALEPVVQSVWSCANSTRRTLEMRCSAGHMLKINRAFYGYSVSGQCAFQSGDCTLMDYQNYACVGKQSCTINLPSGPTGRRIAACNRTSNYFQVDYECIPVIETKDMCDHALLRSQKGYIASPRYPMNYKGTLDCISTIIVNERQTIRLKIIELDLRELLNETEINCVDWLHIHDKTRSTTICGRRGSEDLFSSLVNSLTIRFHAGQGGRNKGFWLYYEAYPPLEPLQTTVANLASDIPKPESSNPKPTETDSHNQQKHGSLLMKVTAGTPREKSTASIPFLVNRHTTKELPFGAIVGGVIGSLCIILIMLLLLLLLQKLRERRALHQKKVPFLEIRNEAFHSNSEIYSADGSYNA